MTQADLYAAEERAIYGTPEPEDYDMRELMDDDSGED